MAKHALITGGTKGIGKSIARCLGKMGYHLILTYATDTATARKFCAALRNECHNEVIALQADSSDPQAIDLVADSLRNEGIRPDVLIFNAGITCRDSLEEMKYEDWERVFFANVHFPVFLIQRLLGEINKGGSVIFTGSLMGIQPHATSLSYGVTKASIHALVKNLVKFLVPYEIRVNAVAPGFVDTEWQKNKPTEIRRRIESKIALGRFCDPDELAGIYQLLIENSYINGEIIIADGGYSYQ
jgi:3-oxoacyl-[acyl-carrier protein] reductase